MEKNHYLRKTKSFEINLLRQEITILITTIKITTKLLIRISQVIQALSKMRALQVMNMLIRNYGTESLNS